MRWPFTRSMAATRASISHEGEGVKGRHCLCCHRWDSYRFSNLFILFLSIINRRPATRKTAPCARQFRNIHMSVHESVPDNFVTFTCLCSKLYRARSCCPWIRAVYNKLHYSLLAALSGGRGKAVDMNSGQFCNNSVFFCFSVVYRLPATRKTAMGARQFRNIHLLVHERAYRAYGAYGVCQTIS